MQISVCLSETPGRKPHSIETALLRVPRDLAVGIGAHHEAVLILLHISAVFDTLDHVLLKRLHNQYRFKGDALSWLRPYLRGRT